MSDMPEHPVVIDADALPSPAEVTRLANAAEGLAEYIDTASRRSKWALIGAVIAILGVLFSFYVRYDGRVAACGRDNKQNQGMLDIADLLEVGLTPEQAQDPSNQAFFALLRDRFALRDCENISWI